MQISSQNTDRNRDAIRTNKRPSKLTEGRFNIFKMLSQKKHCRNSSFSHLFSTPPIHEITDYSNKTGQFPLLLTSIFLTGPSTVAGAPRAHSSSPSFLRPGGDGVNFHSAMLPMLVPHASIPVNHDYTPVAFFMRQREDPCKHI